MKDVESLRAQLVALATSEPPPGSLRAIYFGLFDTLDDSGAEGIGFCVAGTAQYEANDGDSLCDPEWWPDARYLESEASSAVKLAEISSADERDSDAEELFAYAGQLGVALLVSRFASDGLFGNMTRVVGFDSGDFAEV